MGFSYLFKAATVFVPQTVFALWGSYVGSKGIGGGPQRRTRRRGATFVSTLPLWFRAFRPLLACSGLFWPRLRAATAHAVGRGLRTIRANFRRSRRGFARIPLRFDAPAVVWPLLGKTGNMQAVVEFGHSGLGAMCIDKSPAVFEDGGLQIVWWHLLSPVSSKQEIQDEKQIQTAGYRFCQ